MTVNTALDEFYFVYGMTTENIKESLDENTYLGNISTFLCTCIIPPCTIYSPYQVHMSLECIVHHECVIVGQRGVKLW